MFAGIPRLLPLLNPVSLSRVADYTAARALVQNMFHYFAVPGGLIAKPPQEPRT
jgi:hypothetical protein